MFKVGDRVVSRESCMRFYTEGCAGTVLEVFSDGPYYVSFDKVLGVAVKSDGSSAWFVSKLALEVPVPRSNDPATSKGKRRINKYEQAVLTALGSVYFDKALGATGKEIAEHTGHPLNCITPRFAPLRRKGLIKPLKVEVGRGVGQVVKRDKQIVWVLA